MPLRYRPLMPDADKLTPADSSDLAAALAFALRYQGRKRVHNADEIMAEIVPKRLVEHLERAEFVVMKLPAGAGAAALGAGVRGRPLPALPRHSGFDQPSVKFLTSRAAREVWSTCQVKALSERVIFIF